MMKIIGVVIVIGIVYVLYRQGIIKSVRYPPIKLGYTYNHSRNDRLRVSFLLFNGMNNYAFIFKKNQEVTMNYRVSVERGTFRFTVANKRGLLFEKTFTSDEEGSFTFTPDTSPHNLLVDGSFTKGRCEIKFE